MGDAKSDRAAPSNITSLNARIRNVAREGTDKNAWGQAEARLRRTIFNVVAAQMLPAGVVKGGMSLRLRQGERGSRFSNDLDISTAENLEDFLDLLDDRLEEGWSGFSGRVEVRPKASPTGIPEQYVMQPARIRLTYLGGSIGEAVLLEMGGAEVGADQRPDLRMPDDIVDIFRNLGLEDPQPVAVMAVEHQIAQKLHACTYAPAGVNERAHDLVDLQLLAEEHLDLVKIRKVAARLFRYRRAQAWPPTVRAFEGWDELYAEAAQGLGVRGSVGEAVEWANNLIQLIEDAR